MKLSKGKSMQDRLCGPHGAALKRCPTLAAARRALAEDLRRLKRINPELARQVARRLRRDPVFGRSVERAA
jgi:hypothetical protein